MELVSSPSGLHECDGRDWRFKSALALLDVPIPRIGCTDKDGDSIFMFDAGLVWRDLRGVDEQATVADFIADEEHVVGEHYLWVQFTNTGRVFATPTKESMDQSLFVNSQNLHEVLFDPDGFPYPLRPSEGSVWELMREATSWSAESRSRERTMSNVPQSPAEDDIQHQMEETSGKIHCVLSRRGTIWFWVIMSLVSLGMIGCVLGLSFSWASMAQEAMQQPGRNYLESVSQRTSFAINLILNVPRLATSITADLISSVQYREVLEPYNTSEGVITAKAVLDPWNVTKYLAAVIRVGALLPLTQLAFEDGSAYAAVQNPQTLAVVMLVRDAQSILGHGTCLRKYPFVDRFTVNFSAGEPLEAEPCFYDPRSTTWYQKAKADRKPGWGEGIYKDGPTGLLSLGATQPLFVNGSRTNPVIGVAMSSVYLAGISQVMEMISPGKTGAVFITAQKRNDEGQDQMLMIAASSAAVEATANRGSSPTNSLNASEEAKAECRCAFGIFTQLEAQDSPTAAIVEAYTHMSRESGQEALVTRNLTDDGSATIIYASEATPMVAVTQHEYSFGEHDENIDLHWQIWATIPAQDYYGYIMEQNKYVSIVCFSAVVAIFGVVMYKAYHRARDLDGIQRTKESVLRGLVGSSLILAGLYIFWLSTTRDHVNEISTDSMGEVAHRVQDWFSYELHVFAISAILVESLYAIGNLNVHTSEPVEWFVLDAWLVALQGVIQNQVAGVEGDFVGVGFPATGNFIGVRTWEGRIVIAVRSAVSTGGDLVYYGTQGEGHLLTRNTSDVVARFPYNVWNERWFVTGMEIPRASGSNTGLARSLSPAFSSVGQAGELWLSTVCSIFDEGTSSTPIAVFNIQKSPALISARLHEMIPSPDSAMAVLEEAGEVIARANGHVSVPDSAGVLTKANATLMKDQLGVISAELMDEFGMLNLSQGQSSGHGASLWSSTTAANPLFQPPSIGDWTFVQVVPRRYYYDSLDQSTDGTFATLLFVPTALLFMTVIAFRSLERRILQATKMKEVALAVVRHTHQRRASIPGVSGMTRRISDCSEASRPSGGGDGPDSPIIVPGSRRRNRRNSLQPLMLESPQKFTPVGAIALEDPLDCTKPTPATEAKPVKPPSGVAEGRDFLANSQDEPDDMVQTTFHGPECNQADDDPRDSTLGAFRFQDWLFPPNPLDCSMVQLEQLTRDTLRPLVARWQQSKQANPDREEHEDHLQEYVRFKSMEYFKKVSSGIRLHEYSCIDAYYGEHSWRMTAYKIVQHPWIRPICAVALFSLLMIELIPHGDTRTIFNLLLAAVVTGDILTQCSATWSDSNKLVPAGNVVRYTLLAALWIAILVPVWVTDSQDYYLAAFVKPMVVTAKMRRTRAALQVFVQALVDAKVVFGVFLCVVVHAAIVMLLLFTDEYEKSTVLGSTADSFTDSFVAMFIFITSGENWNQIVYPMYDINKASSVFFLTYIVLGTFVLTSLVVATFQDTYSIRQSDIRQVNQQERAAALCCSYVLCTWTDECLTRVAFIDLLCAYWSQACGEGENELTGYTIETATKQLRELLHSMEGPTAQGESLMNKRQTAAVAEGGIGAFRIMLARMIFHMIDADQSGTIEFQEFQEVFAAVACVNEIKKDRILGFTVIAARWEIELEAATGPAETDSTERIFKKAMQDVRDERSKIEAGRHLLGKIAWRDIDCVLIVVQMTHAFILALYTTRAVSQAYGFSSGFTAFYAVEIGLRMRSCGGFFGYLNDNLRIFSSWSNRVQLSLVVVSVFAEMLFLVLPADYSFVFQAIMALVLYRLLLLTESFVQPLHCLWHGLKPILVYVQLFVLVYYLFSLLAWRLFDGTLEADAANFNTLGDSMLLMFQVFVGEGWHEVMQVTTERSNDAYMWFFMVYVLVVGLLFSNLFMGIVIETYQLAERRRSTCQGKVDITLSISSIPENRKCQLFKDLGYIAALIYNPVMHSLDGLSTLGHKFKKVIENGFGGDLEKWAIVTIQRSFRGLRANRVKRFLSSVKKSMAQIRPVRSPPFSKHNPELSYESIKHACQMPWKVNEAEQVQPGAHLATVFALGVMDALMLPKSIVTERPFDQSDYIRSWDMYTFMFWLMPEIVSHLDGSLGQQLKEKVMLRVTPPSKLIPSRVAPRSNTAAQEPSSLERNGGREVGNPLRDWFDSREHVGVDVGLDGESNVGIDVGLDRESDGIDPQEQI